MFLDKIDKNKRIKKEFEAFEKKLNASKHAYWFECLDNKKRFRLLLMLKSKKKLYKNLNKSFSFNKFMFEQRQKKFFKIPINIIRDKAIDKILK